MNHKIIFQPSGRMGYVSHGTTLLEASLELGMDLEAPCGGAGTCGKCKVKIEEGFFEQYGIESKITSLSFVTEKEKQKLSNEEQKDNYRLACCSKILGDCLIFVPEQSSRSKQIILETAKTRKVNFNPSVKKYFVELKKPTLEDDRDDFSRLKDALKDTYDFSKSKIKIDYKVLSALPSILRNCSWKAAVTVWNDNEIIAVEPVSAPKLYGIAIDIGTTTIAACLCELSAGETLKLDSSLNPQVRYGDDVISRISYCMMQQNGLEKMHKLIIDELNILIRRMADSVGIETVQIVEAVLVFNTVMHHIILGIDPQFMGQAPFTSTVRDSLNIKARDLGLEISQSGNVHCLPIKAGFVGADNISVLVAEEPYKQDEKLLIIDIGTNGEIDFGNKDLLYATSCATGPALEGAQIKFGMRAAFGAIEKVKIDPVSLEPDYKVIGDTDWNSLSKANSSKGLCGSGIIDAIAEMFKAGIITKDGRIDKSISSPRIRQGSDGKMEYVLVWSTETSIGQDITVTQKDVRAVQLAKAALYAGAKILLNKSGEAAVDGVILAGAFGSYINKESALVIGLFPDCDLKKVTVVGNAAGEGARLALLDKNKRLEAQEVAGFVQFVESAIEKDFQEHFYDAMNFPHAKDAFPHIQYILDDIKVRR